MKVLVKKDSLETMINVADRYAEEISNKDRFKVLNTIEEAEQYVFENNPCLSYKDVIDLGIFDCTDGKDLEILTNKVKSKL